jgi:alkanesulfonate monooxygenase SsuD/methylene tetrahydromethanopterin reductase-like flavin-dependent oxidoreductase (luciferase family)
VLVYLGAMGDRMTQLAAEAADGIIVSWGWPGMLEGYVTGLRELVAGAGRDPAAFRVVARMYASVTDDASAVRAAVREELVGYLASPAQAAFFARYGFGAEIDAFRDAFARGDRSGTREAISDRLLDALLPTGSARELRRAASERWACGIDDLMVQPVPGALGGDPARTIEALTP